LEGEGQKGKRPKGLNAKIFNKSQNKSKMEAAAGNGL